MSGPGEKERATQEALALIAASRRHIPHSHAAALIRSLYGKVEAAAVKDQGLSASDRRFEVPVLDFARHIGEKRREAEKSGAAAAPDAFLYQSSHSLQRFEQLVLERAAVTDQTAKTRVDGKLLALVPDLMAEGRQMGENPGLVTRGAEAPRDRREEMERPARPAPRNFSTQGSAPESPPAPVSTPAPRPKPRGRDDQWER
jgi:hypothetical protein